MKTPDRDQLLNEVLAPDELRATTLQRTLAATRRHRRGRQAARGVTLLALVGVAAALLWLRKPELSPPVIAVQPTEPIKTVPGTQIREVSDAELLAMFPDRPVALVGPPQHRQFVFLDEKKLAKPADKLTSRGQRL